MTDRRTSDANTPLACVVLAAGMGTRMVSRRPKVLHKVAGRPLIGWLMETLRTLSPDKIVVVAGPDSKEIESATGPGVRIAVQTERKGTADAVRAALPALKGFSGDVLIACGDAPFVDARTLRALADRRRETGAGIAVAAVDDGDPSGYGRMVLDDAGFLDRIVEDKDCTPTQKKIRLWNAGLYAVDGARLEGWIARIGNANAQGEFYLTDLPAIAAGDGAKTAVLTCRDADEFAGVNTREQLADVEKSMQKKLRRAAMAAGATLIDPKTVYLSWDTTIGRDSVIGPHVVFGPGVHVGEGVEILPFSHIEGARVEPGARIGPFARLRPGAHVGEGAHVGNFVEIKNATMGAGAKANHLAYIGDAQIGAKANIGAGVITCNYDGFDKHKTLIGAGAFVGSDVTLVAPVAVGDGAYVGAGSTITRDVPSDALVVARARPTVCEGWARTYREKKGKRKAS
jgi:bifunctional UDP-N-acetylglucosamine pyrophosphorylase/glucosamine-1-phosphate N-acetyltransferase